MHKAPLLVPPLKNQLEQQDASNHDHYSTDPKRVAESLQSSIALILQEPILKDEECDIHYFNLKKDKNIYRIWHDHYKDLITWSDFQKLQDFNVNNPKEGQAVKVPKLDTKQATEVQKIEKVAAQKDATQTKPKKDLVKQKKIVTSSKDIPAKKDAYAEMDAKKIEKTDFIKNEIENSSKTEKVSKKENKIEIFFLKNLLNKFKAEKSDKHSEELGNWPMLKEYKKGELYISSGYLRNGGGGFKKGKPHGAIDLIYLSKNGNWSETLGAPVFATHTGIVIATGHGWGTVHLLMEDGSLGTVYGHMKEINVKVGDKVKRGQKIGNVGDIGAQEGAYHLHYEIFIGKSRPIEASERMNPIEDSEGFSIGFSKNYQIKNPEELLRDE